jgi:hypothetical protein
MTNSQVKWLSSVPKNVEIMHSPGYQDLNTVQYVEVDHSFLENYEKLLTCFLASKIENKRAKYALKKKQERKLMMKKLFDLELGQKNYKTDHDEDKENIGVEQTIDETKNFGKLNKMKKSLFLEHKNNTIPKINQSIGFNMESEEQDRIYQQRKRQLKNEIEELFELEGRTLWNYSTSVKIQEGLLTDLENLFRTNKHNHASYSNGHEEYLKQAEELKQSIDVKLFFI